MNPQRKFWKYFASSLRGIHPPLRGIVQLTNSDVLRFRNWSFTIKCLLFYAIALLAGCDGIVNQLAFFPEHTNINKIEPLPQGVSEVYVKTEDGKNLQCFFVTNTHSDKIIIYFHGNAGNIYQRIPELIDLANAGANVLGVGYRGYGKSTGSPSEKGMYKDGEAALAYAVDKLKFPMNKIYICGRSIGATVAINIAAQKKLVGVILLTPFTTGKEMAKAIGLGPLSFISGDSFDNLSKAKNISCPMLVIHGDKDEVVPYSMGERIYQTINSPKKMVTIAGGHHNDLELVNPELYWGAVKTFVRNNE